jgi:hypothetical protein
MNLHDKVWCCRTSGNGREEAYKYDIPVVRCSDCTICKSVKDYPEDPRQTFKFSEDTNHEVFIN